MGAGHFHGSFLRLSNRHVDLDVSCSMEKTSADVRERQTESSAIRIE